jgi:butyrate kinase
LAPVAPEPKARGGPINAGTYLVGEKGPEILNVGASGNVVSNDSIAALLARTGESDKAITSLMNMLNTQNKQMLSYIAEMTDYTKRNNDALKGMSGDAFA